MKELLRVLWRFKIKVMFYFNLGFSEISNLVNLVKSVLIIVAGLVYLFRFNLSISTITMICVVSFLGCIGLGFILKLTGMADYATKFSNDINPELKLIRKIANHFNINDNE